MENSSRSDEPQVFSTEVGDNEIDYEQRCKYLESQLEKFREQAAKVREVIGQKVCLSSSVVASLLKWLTSVNFAETYQCISVLFVSFFLFSLFCSRFLYDSSYFRRNLQPRQSLQVILIYVGMFVFKLYSTADSKSTGAIFSRLHF